MKKMITVLALVMSVGVFAKGNDRQMMMNSLTETQKVELQKLHSASRKDMSKARLEMEEINLKIRKERLKDSPNQTAIDKLIDAKAKLRAANEKKRVRFQTEVKKKFGIDMRGRKNCRGTGKHMHRGYMKKSS